MICTYDSLDKIQETRKTRYAVPPFDLAIMDEAHRIAGRSDKNWAAVHDNQRIRADRRLHMPPASSRPPNWPSPPTLPAPAATPPPPPARPGASTSPPPTPTVRGQAGGPDRAAPSGPRRPSRSEGGMSVDAPTDRQVQILRVIRNWIADHGEGPSIRQIGERIGLSSSSSVAYQLARLRTVDWSGAPGAVGAPATLGSESGEAVSRAGCVQRSSRVNRHGGERRTPARTGGPASSPAA
ncbi:LexA family protein [Streptomyces atroolivaceus]|uniref:LexA family protein n=1 Tax=Streptomyces atroolivaceus TaxID=66869 RepID=UPI0036448C79